MSRVLGVIVALLVAFATWSVVSLARTSAEGRKLAEASAASQAVSDSLRARVAALDSLSSAALDSLALERARITERVVVIERERERAVHVSDSTWSDLYVAIQDSFPELAPLADAVNTSRQEERTRWETQNRAMARLMVMADSTSAIWRNRFNEERALRLGVATELVDVAAERDFWRAEATGFSLPSVFSALPGWAQVAGKVALCAAITTGGVVLDGPKTGIVGGAGCVAGTVS